MEDPAGKFARSEQYSIQERRKHMIRYFVMKRREWKIKAALYKTILDLMEMPAEEWKKLFTEKGKEA